MAFSISLTTSGCQFHSSSTYKLATNFHQKLVLVIELGSHSITAQTLTLKIEFLHTGLGLAVI